MSTTVLAEGRTFIRAGKSVNSLYLITEGSVLAYRNGQEFLLHNGDIIGMCELNSPIHLFSYKTNEKCSLETYSYSGIDNLSTIFKENPLFAKLCLFSSFRQCYFLYEQYFSSLDETTTIYQNLINDQTLYHQLCLKYNLEETKCFQADSLSPFLETESLEDWNYEYFTGFLRILKENSNIFTNEPNVLTGIIQNNATSCTRLFPLADRIYAYLSQMYEYYTSKSQNNFFDLFVSILSYIGMASEDSKLLQECINRILLQTEQSIYCDRSAIHLKSNEYQKLISSVKRPSVHKEILDFSNSFEDILSFSTLEKEEKSVFLEKVTIYKELKDRSSQEDNVSKLRNEITLLFYKLYENIVLNSLETPALPPVVRMFLYFGYVDETLAGKENTQLLYDYCNQISTEHKHYFYTFYDWLLSIYQGENEPSRNTFDEDYSDCLHTQKIEGKITAQEETQLLQDQKQKLLFELRNLFPSANKITYGRITTYCPLFSEHNLFRPLDSTFVSFEAICQILEQIKKADFKAFYVENRFYDSKYDLRKEIIHTNCPPNIILMPCAGTRGIMWQEIEGKKRTTSARFMLPIFQMEDLTQCLIHMVGEYRWEMTRRIQGTRWNDFTEPSLTSEYFDYLQFYKKNPEFSPEIKEKIKVSLLKSKNSFKEKFVQDYITWILYESTGSPRLNKISRAILFKYCPFSLSVRTPLLMNPIFKDPIEYYELKKKQKLYKMDNLFLKIKNSGQEIPPELEQEYHFLSM